MLPNLPKYKDFQRALYAYKADDEPKKANVTKTKSGYKGVENSQFNTNFASGSSGLIADPNDPRGKKKIYQTNASLSPQLGQVANTAQTGLGANLSYLQSDPQQRVQSLLNGENPTYNVLKEQYDRDQAQVIARNQIDAQKGGFSNSSTLGSALGRIYGDDPLHRNQLLMAGLDWGNNNARTDAQLNLGAITGLNSLVTPVGSAAAAQLQAAKSSQDQAAAASAQAENAAEMQYTQAMNQYNAQKSAGMGNMIGAGLGMLGSIGGNMLLPGVGGMLGGQLGKMASGGLGSFGIGGSSSPVWGSGYSSLAV